MAYKQFNVVRGWTVLTVWYFVFVFISIICAILLQIHSIIKFSIINKNRKQ